MRVPIKKLSVWFTFSLLILVLFLSGLNTISRRHWLLEMNSSFSVHYLFLQILLLILLLLQRKRFYWMVLVVSIPLLVGFSCFYLRDIIPFYSSEKINAASSGKSQHRFSVLFADLHNVTNFESELHGLVQEFNPDLFALANLPSGFDLLEASGKHYPYQAGSNKGVSEGALLFSRIQFQNQPMVYLGDYFPPVVSADLVIGDQTPVTVSFFQAAPKGESRADGFFYNRIVYRRFLTYLKFNSSDRLIFGGSLNVTPFSGFYKMIRWYLKLKNTRSGKGMGAALEFSPFLFSFPSSHIFYRGKLKLVSFEDLLTSEEDVSVLYSVFEVKE